MYDNDATVVNVTTLTKNPTFLLNVQYNFSKEMKKRICEEIMKNGFLQVAVGEMRIDNPKINMSKGDVFIDLSGLGKRLISSNIKLYNETS